MKASSELNVSTKKESVKTFLSKDLLYGNFVKVSLLSLFIALCLYSDIDFCLVLISPLIAFIPLYLSDLHYVAKWDSYLLNSAWIDFTLYIQSTSTLQDGKEVSHVETNADDSDSSEEDCATVFKYVVVLYNCQ